MSNWLHDFFILPFPWLVNCKPVLFPTKLKVTLKQPILPVTILENPKTTAYPRSNETICFKVRQATLITGAKKRGLSY
jgi:hypothetical protein